MEILRENTKKTIKLLKKIPYKPTDSNKSAIFFPLANKTIDDDMLILDTKSAKGSASYLKPGLILLKTENGTAVQLAYAQTEYSPKFDLSDYLDLQDHRISKKDYDELVSLDCLIVKNDYVVGLFEI